MGFKITLYRGLLIAACMVGMSATTACSKTYSWQQKLTMEVETPNGDKIASAVTMAQWSTPPGWFKIGDSGGGLGAGVLSGEAITLEIAPGRFIFALLKNYSPETAINSILNEIPHQHSRHAFASALQRIENEGMAKNLSASEFPLLITFRNHHQPETIEIVDPLKLEASFGPGYNLKSFVLSTTDEKMTTGRVEGVLPWILSIHGRLKPSDAKYSDELHEENNIYRADFLR